MPFGDITQAMTNWFALRSAGLALLLIGHIAFLINFAWIICPFNSSGSAPAQFRPPPVLPLSQGPAAEGHA